MEIADIDESGTIDKQEFAVFVKKLDKSVDDDKCNEIFEA
jgi:Ca2+-binding EF-hand superfamily protein